jgi:hypothetical protein
MATKMLRKIWCIIENKKVHIRINFSGKNIHISRKNLASQRNKKVNPGTKLWS